MSVAPQEFFERIQDTDGEPSPVTVRVVARPNNIASKSQQVYHAPRPEPVNSGERYMREHYNNGESVPEVIDKSCCGRIKRHKFRFLLIILAIASLILLIIFGILYFAF
ncbi:hypothetical protein PRIPAC_95350 [Pristionchus pacificus]|uniref:Uncharacterized protein n=1 Tax=Pristionchus pacificus TaxID=54126 RepID=A0A454XVJ8_PRIPA|nr:hypothetical protein PRIPAC_95350 [Pristionchus pacificus]|eukprot:PDM63776.1 hypothetical protein PRIPAC_49749 [Pristionchus pacificus]